MLLFETNIDAYFGQAPMIAFVAEKYLKHSHFCKRVAITTYSGSLGTRPFTCFIIKQVTREIRQAYVTLIIMQYLKLPENMKIVNINVINKVNKQMRK